MNIFQYYKSLESLSKDKLSEIIEQWSSEAGKRTLDYEIELYDATQHFNETESGLIKKTINGGGEVYIGIIGNAAGTLSCMKTEEYVGHDIFEITARLISNINHAAGFQRYLIYGRELKWSIDEEKSYQEFLAKNGFTGAGTGKKHIITGLNDNIGKGIRYREMRGALDESGFDAGGDGLVLLSSGKNSRRSLENIAGTIEKIAENDIQLFT